MTAPYADAPDGAVAIGGKYYQDITEQSARQMMTGRAGDIYTDAAGSWLGVVDDVADTADKVNDGQLDMNERVDLLESIVGYCSTFMSKNWTVKGGAKVALPFDAQLGPNRGARPDGNGGILMETRGLWRCDGHLSFYPPAAGWGSTTVSAKVYISVINKTSDLVFTEREFDIVITSYGAETAAFNTTFVIPNDDTYRVVMQVSHGKTNANVYGGTLRSALSVNKWDFNVDNAIDLPVAPEGGTLS